MGKSSLLNRLLGSGVARTSGKPGCTQLIHFYRVEEGFCVVDLPGYGFAKVPKQVQEGWRELVEAYLLGRTRLALSILLLDVRRGWMDKDIELKKWLEFHQRRHLVVATKIDKLKPSETVRSLRAIQDGGDPAIACSAVTGQGVREIWQAIWKIQNNP